MLNRLIKVPEQSLFPLGPREEQKNKHLDSVFRGNTLMFLGNTESMAGSDLSSAACRAPMGLLAPALIF